MASWSALYDNILPSGATAGYTPVNSQALRLGTTVTIDKNTHDFTVASRMFRSYRHGAKLRAYLQAAIGAASGASVNSAAALTATFVKHPSTPTSVGAFAGNNRQASSAVDSATLISASTTTAAADNTNLKAGFAKAFAIVPASMPADRGGNGGGGKLTYAYK